MVPPRSLQPLPPPAEQDALFETPAAGPPAGVTPAALRTEYAAQQEAIRHAGGATAALPVLPVLPGLPSRKLRPGGSASSCCWPRNPRAP